MARFTTDPTAPPSRGTVSPNPATGVNQTFTTTFFSQNGKDYTDLTWADVLINAGLQGANACYVKYYRPTNSLYLQNDANTASLGPLTPGSAGTLSNSQCTINGAGTTVSGTATRLTLNVAVTAMGSFLPAGKAYDVYLYVGDSEGVASGWAANGYPEGSWTPVP